MQIEPEMYVDEPGDLRQKGRLAAERAEAIEEAQGGEESSLWKAISVVRTGACLMTLTALFWFADLSGNVKGFAGFL